MWCNGGSRMKRLHCLQELLSGKAMVRSSLFVNDSHLIVDYLIVLQLSLCIQILLHCLLFLTAKNAMGRRGDAKKYRLN